MNGIYDCEYDVEVVAVGEDRLAELLNERSRAGWLVDQVIDRGELIVIFRRCRGGNCCSGVVVCCCIRPSEPADEEEGPKVSSFTINIETKHENLDVNDVAFATVYVNDLPVSAKTQVAAGEIAEGRPHPPAFINLRHPADITDPFAIEIHHPGTATDEVPHWRMSFQLTATLTDGTIVDCDIALQQASNFSMHNNVPHLNFEDYHRFSGQMPIVLRP